MRKNPLHRAKRILGTLFLLGAVASGVSIAVMVFVITAYAICRGFGLSWLFVEEWGGYLLVLVTYAGAAYTMQEERHIQVTMVLNNVSAKAKTLLTVFLSLVSIPIIGYLTWLSADRVIENIRQGDHSLYYSQTPLWIPSIFIPIGLGLLGLAVVLYFLQAVMAMISGISAEHKEALRSGE